MFDVVGNHSIAAKANRYTTIKGLTEGQLWAEVVKGIIEQIWWVCRPFTITWSGYLHSRAYSRGVALLENHALL